MGFTARRIAWLSAALALVASCVSPRTQVAIRVSTNMTQGPGQTLQGVQIMVFSPTTATVPIYNVVDHIGDTTSNGPIWLPRDLLVLYPGDNNRAEPFRVIVMPLGSADVALFLSPEVAVANFEVGQSRELPIFLPAQCQTVRCPDGTTCAPDGSCVDDHVRMLSPLDGSVDPDAPLMEASADATMDAATDATIDATSDADANPCSGSDVCVPDASEACGCGGTRMCAATCQWGTCSSTGCPSGQVCRSGRCCDDSCPSMPRCFRNGCGRLCDNCPSTAQFDSPTTCVMVTGPGVQLYCDSTTLACVCPSGPASCCGGGCCP